MKRLHLLLTVKDNAANIPKNLEARRRLQFFTNSLFMDMPQAKAVCEMMPFWYDYWVIVSTISCHYYLEISPFIMINNFNDLPTILTSCFNLFEIVSSLRTTAKQCFTATLICGLKMKMEYQFFSIYKKYFLVCHLI